MARDDILQVVDGPVRTALIAIGIVATLFFLTPVLPYLNPEGMPLFYDDWDLIVYFRSSTWVVSELALYRNIDTEYPLLANLIFGALRYVSDILRPMMEWLLPANVDKLSASFSFIWVWISTSALLLIYLIRQSSAVYRLNWLLWLTPGALYFSLYRFDLFPAFACFVCLLCLQRSRIGWASLWLGIAVALKGYALFFVPVYCLYLWQQNGFLKATLQGTIVITPFAAFNAATVLYAGVDAWWTTYAFHLDRGMNRESTYEALVYGMRFVSDTGHKEVYSFFADGAVAKLAQVFVVIVAIVAKPKTLEELTASFLLVTMGFIVFNIFSSPQFLLWILPFVCFLRHRLLLVLTVTYGVYSYLCFPIAYTIGGPTYQIAEIGLALIRIAILVLAFRLIGLEWRWRKTEALHPATV